MSTCVQTAFRMDSAYHPLAGKQDPREDNGSYAKEVRGLQRLSPKAQASQGPGKMPVGDQFQHFADETEDQQQASFHAIRREDGLSK